MITANHSSIKALTVQFARLFTSKDAEGIRSLLAENFALYDPALKWVRGRGKVVDVIKKQFQETKNVSYEVVNAYEDGNMGILEFKITLDKLVLYGVDFMHWENGKMIELRCYYNPPNPPQSEELKPLSAEAKSLREGEIYEHYKGKHYEVIGVAHHSETMEELVVYKALYDTEFGFGSLWVRPRAMFEEIIEINGQQRARFKYIGNV